MFDGDYLRQHVGLRSQWLTVAGCFLGELHARAQAEFGVDVVEVGRDVDLGHAGCVVLDQCSRSIPALACVDASCPLGCEPRVEA